MPDIDFTKVERLFDLGITDFESQNIQFLAQIASAMGEMSTDDIETPQTQEQIKRAREIIAFHVKRELKYIATNDKTLLRKLGGTKKRIEDLLADPMAVTEEDWKKILQIRETLRSFREEIRKQLVTESDEDKVLRERKKSKSFRFNIRDHWLPLK